MDWVTWAIWAALHYFCILVIFSWCHTSNIFMRCFHFVLKKITDKIQKKQKKLRNNPDFVFLCPLFYEMCNIPSACKNKICLNYCTHITTEHQIKCPWTSDTPAFMKAKSSKTSKEHTKTPCIHLPKLFYLVMYLFIFFIYQNYARYTHQGYLIAQKFVFNSQLLRSYSIPYMNNLISPWGHT